MKSCPKCQRVFPNDAGFCPADGTGLVFTSMVPLAASDDPRIGARLCNRYELRRVVADGGMGRVYEGVDKQTDTRIAVKVLHEDVAKDEVALARFKREYEISSQLPHDHIVKVLDFQRDPVSQIWLLVMEFLDGEELRYILKREKTLPPARLIRMLAQTALGLDGAHAKQLVHRDLKPDNLFLCGTRDGDNVKILDFGSVKDKSGGAKKLTVLGTAIGSPYYMSPEQAQGLETIDARSDVFALAAVAYECVTGSVPFSGNNGPSILLAILTKDPTPPSIKGKDAPVAPPPGLDEVMELGLAKNMNHRQASVGALVDQIGKAYGLTGDHRQWATMPLSELTRVLDEARPAVMAAAARGAAAVEADPFAAPPPGQAGVGGGGMMQQAPAPQGRQAAMQMDQAFQAARPMNAYDEMPRGVPGVGGARPGWLLPVIVGVAALLVGGGLALVVMFLR